MNTKEIAVIAVDRAEPELARACKKLEALKRVKVKGYQIVNLSFKNSPSYHGNAAQEMFEEIVIDFNNTEGLKHMLSKICQNKEVILHCRMDKAIKDYAILIPLTPSKYNPTPDALVKSTEKDLMRKTISNVYPEICPKFLQITRLADVNEESLSGFDFPVIVKPNGLHSSLLVTKCNNPQEVLLCIKDTLGSLKRIYHEEYGTGVPSLLIEEFMAGDMYSIDAYTDNTGNTLCLPPVKVITAAQLGLDGYYSYRHIIPTTLNKSQVDEANACAIKAINAIGLRNCTSHIELYHTSEGWKIIELGPRIGGYRQDLYMEAFGIDHYYNDLLIHLGLKPNIEHKYVRYAAGLNIYAEKEGIIESIEGFSEALSIESVVYLKLHAQPGGSAVFASKGGLYLVDGILSNDNCDRLEDDVKKVRNLIQFHVSQT